MENYNFKNDELEDEKRREILLDSLKEIHLFNLQQEEEEEETTDDHHSKESTEMDFILPPGIKIFMGPLHSLYNEVSIRPESFSKHFEDVEDVVSLFENLEWRARYDILIHTSFIKDFIRYFFKLLFTRQSQDLLHIISSTLLDVISKNLKLDSMLKILLEELRPGIVNLGGQANVILGDDVKMSSSMDQTSLVAEEFSPLHNLKCVFRIIKYTIIRTQKWIASKGLISVSQIDLMIFIIIIIAHDPMVLNSSFVGDAQDFLAVLLDLYPSDVTFLGKVQDLVEKIAIYWEDSPQGFNHHTAYYVTCNILPISKRGLQLKGSVAYYSLMCCIVPAEESVEVVDLVTMSKLSEFCRKYATDIKDLDSYTLYSVIKLIDAAIKRPLDKSYKEQLKYITETVIASITLSKFNDINDFFNNVKLKSLCEEVKSEWGRLMKDEEENLKPMTIPTFVTADNSQDDDDDEDDDDDDNDEWIRRRAPNVAVPGSIPNPGMSGNKRQRT